MKTNRNTAWAPAAILMLLTPAAVAADPSPERARELVRMVRQDCGSCHGLTRLVDAPQTAHC